MYLLFLFATCVLAESTAPKLANALDWQQRFCRHLCDRSLGCRMSNKGSYCKVDKSPPVCFGMSRLPRKVAALVEQVRTPLMFCNGTDQDDKRCSDPRVRPVGCGRRPKWNKEGRVVDLDNFLEGE
jgi:hypothetical protein